MSRLAAVPLPYVLRNLLARRLTTLLTAGGMALVAFVFATVLMLTQGIRETMVQTGQPDNVVVIRKGSATEVQSSIERSQAAVIASLPGIAAGADGAPMVSREPVVLITLPKRDSGKLANVVVRGVEPAGITLRPQARLVAGRMFRPGTSEIVAGAALARGFAGAGLGETVRFGQRDWTVVGVFDAGRTGFNSEIWGDSDQMLQAFRRPAYSAMLFRLADPDRFDRVLAAIEDDPRLQNEARRENRFYAEQSELMANFIGILGTALSIIFSIGAIVGAMITMYASVANRTTEIGTLRALGFPRRSIMVAFLVESLSLGLIGGIAGLLGASLLQNLSISTMNWQTFSELAFSFRLDATIVARTLGFALVMGLIGGVLPAARAARLTIVDALRAA